MTTTTAKAPLPNGIVSYEEYTAKNKVKPTNNTMDQGAFLTLFTTQLRNQNPLDPVKNEAFVAQLAQFSQLEATTKMADSMSSMASSMQSDRLLAGTSLIGKKVATPNGSAELLEGSNIAGVVSAPNGADKVALEVYDSLGRKVFTQTLGRQAPGDVQVKWEGYNDKGERMPPGRYKVQATVSSFGKVTQVPISTPATVRSVTFNGTTNEMMVEVEGGGSVPLSQIKRVDS